VSKKFVFHKLSGIPRLIQVDVCIPKFHSNSANPLSFIKTCHYQAQVIEKRTP
jgi:hypothetical protein